MTFRFRIIDTCIDFYIIFVIPLAFGDIVLKENL